MPVEDRKDTIAFIICVNNELYFEECRYYIEHLEVSAGYDIDVIGIWEADSMCAAYNLGMRSSDAKYKVYMHQDVFIRDSRFLEKTLRIFKEHPKTGMIGMVGGIGIPENGVVYSSWNVGKVDCREPDLSYVLLCGPNQTKDQTVDAVDGLLMMTQFVGGKICLMVGISMMCRRRLNSAGQAMRLWCLIRKNPGWCTTADSQSSPIMTGTGKSVWKSIRNFSTFRRGRSCSRAESGIS